jgi:hypothetical protein
MSQQEKNILSCAGDEMQSGHLGKKLFANPCLLLTMSLTALSCLGRA